MQVTENTQELLCVTILSHSFQWRDKNRFFLLSTTLQLQSPNNYGWWVGSSWPHRLTEKLTNCPVDLSTRHKLATTTMPDAGVCNKNLQGQIRRSQHINEKQKIQNKSKQRFTMPSENQHCLVTFIIWIPLKAMQKQSTKTKSLLPQKSFVLRNTADSTDSVAAAGK